MNATDCYPTGYTPARRSGHRCAVCGIAFAHPAPAANENGDRICRECRAKTPTQTYIDLPL